LKSWYVKQETRNADVQFVNEQRLRSSSFTQLGSAYSCRMRIHIAITLLQKIKKLISGTDITNFIKSASEQMKIRTQNIKHFTSVYFSIKTSLTGNNSFLLALVRFEGEEDE
jgi:hypothetical protein